MSHRCSGLFRQDLILWNELAPSWFQGLDRYTSRRSSEP
jgi:hypothetical protein